MHITLINGLKYAPIVRKVSTRRSVLRMQQVLPIC